MADQFLGELRLFPFNFAPSGWATCQGQLLSIRQNTALFSILGTNFGGDGTSNFGLPNLQGAVPIGQGSGPGLSPRAVGETGGEERVTLLAPQMPLHRHPMTAIAGSATAGSPAGLAPAEGRGQGRGSFAINTFTSNPPATTLTPGSVAMTGANQPHNNIQPSLVMTWCIALTGIFPVRN